MAAPDSRPNRLLALTRAIAARAARAVPAPLRSRLAGIDALSPAVAIWVAAVALAAAILAGGPGAPGAILALVPFFAAAALTAPASLSRRRRLAIALGAPAVAALVVAVVAGAPGHAAAAVAGALALTLVRCAGEAREARVEEPLRRLAELNSSVAHNAGTLASSTSEILATVSSQNESASGQAAAIQQVSMTVDAVRSASEHAASRAQQVAASAQDSLAVSAEGRQAVDDIVAGMNQIRAKVDDIAQDILALSEQTQQIGAITATVRDIADQSNLLALNATIEAARAGEHGKGFAVVADQVRRLAEQSKEATAQVNSILGEIQKATNAVVMNAGQGTTVVKAGTGLAERAGAVFGQLSGALQEAASFAQEIAASTQAQTAGIDQISLAMRETEQASQQIVAGVRQSEVAARDLGELAAGLRQLVDAPDETAAAPA